MHTSLSPTRVRFGVFELDADRGELRKDGVAVRIAPQPLAVLQLLVARAGEIVTREDLIRHVWGTETFVDFDRGLNFCIAQVRAALGDDTAKPIYVQTLPKRGYRFIAPIAGAPPTNDRLVDPTPRNLRPYRALAYIGGGLIVAIVVLLAFFLALGIVLQELPPKRFRNQTPRPSTVVAVAVLPFEDLTPTAAAATARTGAGTSASADADRFSDGLTDELIGTLGRAAPERLTVIARTSVMKYRHTKADVRDIGRDLHVGFVIEGSVRRAGDRAEAEARLVDVSTRQAVWSQKFARQVYDEFDLQSSMATSIAAAVSSHLILPAARMPAPPSVSAAAGERFMNGRYLLRKGDPDSLARSVEEFRAAIREDARFAAAHAGLTEALLAQVLTGARPARDVAAEARQASDKATFLDPDLPEARIADGLVALWLEWDPGSAEGAFRLALAKNPSHAAAHHDLAWAMLAQSDVQRAVTEITRAFELDPLSTRASLDIGWVYLRARKYDEAIAHCRRTLDLEPNHPGAQGCLEWGYRKTGRLDEAWTVARRGLNQSGPSTGPAIDIDDARVGLQRVTEQRLRQVMARRHVNPYQIATLYSMLGDTDAAFRWLDRAFDEHDNSLVLLPVDPEWDAVRTDPRLTRLIARVRATAGRRACGADPRPPCVPA